MSHPPDNARVLELFNAALEHTQERREAFLREACDGDAALLGKVEELIRDHEAARTTSVVADPPGRNPESIGPYKVLERLGEGGMGVVYLAEQSQPVRRRVAIKVIRGELVTREMVARFQIERDALARMDHPGISRILDAGETEQGNPYFVMEHVAGVPFLEYCDAGRVSIDERLRLFVEVCNAVQHAHQRGVIHRDIKPSNVLVTEQDGKAVPKVIDFGVAKATHQPLGELTVHTLAGGLVGTPEYMSPEQAKATPLDIDTRSDVYALGVLLYQLLTGSLPFRFARTADLAEIQKVICEQDPDSPSTRVRIERNATAAERRATGVNSLVRRLRGDLDWISLKALEKERGRRYGSASELAADVNRYLSLDPVSAGPPGFFYRLRKLVRRHKLEAAFVGLLMVLVAGFAVRERIQASRIAKEAATTQAVSDFLVDLFEVADPSEARGNRVTAREILDRGAIEVRRRLEDQPVVGSRLLGVIGNVYSNLGLLRRAEPLLLQSYEQRLENQGDEHPDTLRSRADLAKLYGRLGRYDEAEPIQREILQARRQVLGADHPDTLRGMVALGDTLRRLSRYGEAESLFVAALEAQRSQLGEAHPDALDSLLSLAFLRQAQGQYDEALGLAREARELHESSLGYDHPATLMSMDVVAMLHTDRGAYAEAAEVHRAILKLRREVLGSEHPSLFNTLNNLANTYSYRGEFETAEPLYQEALEAQRRLLGADHPDTLNTLDNLAALALVTKNYGLAEGLLLDAVESRRRVNGPRHSDTLLAMGNLAVLRRSQEKFTEAESLYLQILEGQRQTLGEEHPDTALTIHGLACVLRELVREEESDRLFRKAQQVFEARFEPAHPWPVENLKQHSILLRNMKRDAEAEEMERRVLALMESSE